MNRIIRFVFLFLLLPYTVMADELPALHVEGRWLCNPEGEHVTLHGFGQTYSPWFNEQGKGWGWGYDVDACLKYNKSLIDKILAAGWKMDWLRLHMDPHWSNTPGVNTTGENDISAFSETRFRTYLDQVFVPMAEYANAHGLYVVMRPPGVCPEKLAYGDKYHEYLIKVWRIVASHPSLRNQPGIMFELANEPIDMRAPDGQYSSWSDGSVSECARFFQKVVDIIRECGADNVLWVPGLGYQSQYAGFVDHPVTGDNIGYAVHCYPGWYGSDSEADNGSAEQGVVTRGAGYIEFLAGWKNQVMPLAEVAPVIVTEMDWAPKKYDRSWGKATTGIAGSIGFGANFKYIMDKTGNVSWMLFTGPEHLAKYDDSKPDGQTFLTDPEACPRPIYRWYQEYADPNWQFEDTIQIHTLYFPGTETALNPNIWETGSYDYETGCLITGQYGFGGWQFGRGLDLSQWKYLVIRLSSVPQSDGWSFRMFDENNYWTSCYQNDFHKATEIIVPLHNIYRTIDGKVSTRRIDPSHIYIAGFWSYGNTPLYIDRMYLTNRDDHQEETAIRTVMADAQADAAVTDLMGRRVSQMRPGHVYITGGRKNIR